MNLKHKALWEQKQEGIVKRTIVRSRLADLKRRQESNLDDRRNRYVLTTVMESIML
jgi:hypothetical protein